MASIITHVLAKFLEIWTFSKIARLLTILLLSFNQNPFGTFGDLHVRSNKETDIQTEKK